MNAVAAIAITLAKAQTDEFKQYAHQVLKNAKVLAQSLMDSQASLVTGGTDNHMMVVNTVESYGLDGKVAEQVLDKASITTNKQIIPDDPNPPLRPSGIRIGTPAATARGMVESDMEQLAAWITTCMQNPENEDTLNQVKGEVETFCRQFPVPGLE
jgi:glycine hydroxymethyltransferase